MIQFTSAELSEDTIEFFFGELVHKIRSEAEQIKTLGFDLWGCEYPLERLDDIRHHLQCINKTLEPLDDLLQRIGEANGKTNIQSPNEPDN